MAKHKTPMLDQLESGPWPSFVSDMKELAEHRAKTASKIDYQIPVDVVDDVLGLMELTYKHGRTHWKHG
ncbi:MAG: sulfite reductase, dissimilatory-type subunit alpha, partial [Desulfobacterales bacterium]|nr:sulfite reductase, dissimilatory-type subunit alpha [Desulfobacterales bacterium]